MTSDVHRRKITTKNITTKFGFFVKRVKTNNLKLYKILFLVHVKVTWKLGRDCHSNWTFLTWINRVECLCVRVKTIISCFSFLRLGWHFLLTTIKLSTIESFISNFFLSLQTHQKNKRPQQRKVGVKIIHK